MRTYLAIACALIVVGVGAALLFWRPVATEPISRTSDVRLMGSATTTEQSQSARVVPADAREYRSAQYHFSLLYPQELSVAEHDEGGGASTITFQNVDKAEGFQIFIVPYDLPQISDERFKQDEPSGVRESLTPVTVDGATGAAFYSTSVSLGKTREVWFVHGGFLYEVTTLKPLDTWLASILATWRFL